MDKHTKLLQEKFSHSTNNILYNSGGNLMWSLFRFESGSVTVYYHEIDTYHIIHKIDAGKFSLEEIADNWDPVNCEVIFN